MCQKPNLVVTAYKCKYQSTNRETEAKRRVEQLGGVERGGRRGSTRALYLLRRLGRQVLLACNRGDTEGNEEEEECAAKTTFASARSIRQHRTAIWLTRKTLLRQRRSHS